MRFRSSIEVREHGAKLGREDLIKLEGVISESLSGSRFSVKLSDGRILGAKLSGNLRRHHIRVLVGDKVTLGVSPYDWSHGLIVARERLNNRK